MCTKIKKLLVLIIILISLLNVHAAVTSYYPLDDGVLDRYNNNSGILIGDANITKAKIKRGYNFTRGNKILINDSNSLDLDQNITLQAWVNLRDNFTDTVKQTHLGYSHTCFEYYNGSFECFGKNDNGQLGLGYSNSFNSTRNQISISHSQIELGDLHTCSINNKDNVLCWGDNTFGQIGDGTTTDRTSPTAISNTENTSNICVGGRHTCRALFNGSVECWGSNTDGQLGNGSIGNIATTPLRIGIENAIDLHCGFSNTCALLQNSSVYCWGDNAFGQLADGTTTDSPLPKFVNENVSQLSLFENTACGLLQNGTVQCWGDNAWGQVGDGTESNTKTSIVNSNVFNVTSIHTGSDHTCALHNNNSVSCWGINDVNGILGNGTNVAGSNSLAPQIIAEDVKNISTGGESTCIIYLNDTLACWGENDNGQLGDQTTLDKYNPTNNIIERNSVEQLLIGKEGAWGIKLLNNTATAFIGTTEISTTLPYNEWTYLSLIYDKTVMYLFNNSNVQFSALSIAIPTNDDDVFIGENLEGLVDEVAIYNEAITTTEAGTDYQVTNQKLNNYFNEYPEMLDLDINTNSIGVSGNVTIFANESSFHIADPTSGNTTTLSMYCSYDTTRPNASNSICLDSSKNTSTDPYNFTCNIDTNIAPDTYNVTCKVFNNLYDNAQDTYQIMVLTEAITNVTSCKGLKNSIYHNLSVELRSDVDCQGVDFVGWHGANITTYRNNYFEGNNYALNNINITSANEYTGLFPKTNNVSIRNLFINNLTINNSNNYTGLIGFANNSEFRNITLNGRIDGYNGTGALIGLATSLNIYNITINGIVEGLNYIGGLVGITNTVNIFDSIIEANISANNIVGGIVGHSTFTNITNSSSIVKITSNNYTGGIVGQTNEVKLNISKANVNITATDFVGGLVGFGEQLQVNESFATGLISANNYTGGLVGNLTGFIFNSYSLVNISSTGSHVGGLVGLAAGAITNTFAAGVLTLTGTPIGGLIALNTATTISSYWDTDITTITSSAAGTAKTTAELILESTFTGWDFTNIWNKTTDSYPYLRNNNQTIEPIVADNVAPTILSNTTVPNSTNGALNYTGQATVFNLTLNDTTGLNSTVFLNLSGTLIPVELANNKSYNYSIILAADNYTYNWIYSDSLNNTNSTSLVNYTINKNQTIGTLLLNGSASNLSLIANQNATINSSLNIAGLNYQLTINGNSTNYTSAQEFNYTNNTDANISVNLFFSGNQNYTAVNITRNIQFTTLPSLNLISINGLNITTFNNSNISVRSFFELEFDNNISSIDFNISSIDFNITQSGTNKEFIYEIDGTNITIYPIEKLEENKTTNLILNLIQDSNNINYTGSISVTTKLNDVDEDDTADIDEAGDKDGDTLADGLDNANGNQILSNKNLTTKINDSNVVASTYTGVQNISFTNGSFTFAEFEFNFSNTLELDNISLMIDEGMIIAKRINEINNKSLFFVHSNNSENDLCVIDSASALPSSFTSTCSGNGQVFVECDGTLNNGYNCTKENDVFTIHGLNHSIVKAQCSESWSYSSYGTCVGGTQSRTATDANNCGTTFKRASLTQSCTVSSSGSSGGGGGSSGSRARVVSPSQEETQEVESETEDTSEPNTETENNEENNEQNEQTQIEITEPSSGGGSDPCQPNRLEFERIDSCNFALLTGINEFGDTTIIDIRNGEIYHDVNRNVYYVPLNTEFIMSNTDPAFRPDIIFEGGLDMQNKAEEFILDYQDKSVVLVVKKGEILIKKLEEIVDTIASGNAFITSIIDGGKVKTVFDVNSDINNIVNNIRNQIRDADGDIFVVQAPQTEEEEPESNVVLFMGLASLVIFAAVYYAGEIKSVISHKTVRPALKPSVKSEVPDIEQVVEKQIGYKYKATDMKKIFDRSYKKSGSQPAAMSSSTWDKLMGPDSVQKLDDLFLKGKITQQQYEARLRKILQKSRK